MQPRNLAARAGRWSAQHRKTAILGWLLFVVLATVIGGNVGQKTLEPSAMGNGESKRGELIVADAGFPDEVGEQVLIQGKGSVKADGPEVTAAVKDVVSRLERIDGVSNIESPLVAEHRASTVSHDGRSVVVNFKLPGTAETVEEMEALEQSADAPLAAVAAVQKAHPELRVEEYGAASERKALGEQERADEAKQTQLSMGGTLHHPAARLRRHGRRRRPAAARRHLRRGHHRAARADQPARPAARRGRPGRHARRSCRRRRLRHVLPAPHDGGARQGPLRPTSRWTSPPPRRAARS